MRSLLRNLRDSEDGQALTELALVLPILLIVLVGIVELGHAVNTWNNDTDTANVAARYAIVGNLPERYPCGEEKTVKPSTLDELIKCSAKSEGTPGEVTSCVSIPTAAIGEPVEVKVYSKYKWLSYLKFSPAEAAVTGSATMRLETVPSANLGYQAAPCK
jgi:Flp pilus assembly protein TadG